MSLVANVSIVTIKKKLPDGSFLMIRAIYQAALPVFLLFCTLSMHRVLLFELLILQKINARGARTPRGTFKIQVRLRVACKSRPTNHDRGRGSGQYLMASSASKEATDGSIILRGQGEHDAF